MPKETIGREMQTSEDYPRSRVILKWGRESGDCQIGVEFDEWFSFHKDAGDREVAEYRSLWFSFETREDFNRLIRSLRKARDDVFGRDA